MKDEMDTSESYTDKLAKKIWDYHLMHQVVRKADGIFVLGSNDLRVVDRAVELFTQGYAPFIVFSGNVGALTKNLFSKPEAEVFADKAKEMGVPEQAILIENRSTNTGENIRLTRELLKEKGLEIESLILIQKPYMERRTYATYKKEWPELDGIVTSPQISFEDYPTKDISKELMINLLVGDLQRIKLYGKLGIQIPQEVPTDVWEAYEELLALGYTKHLTI
ncbi:YdcF family protein [Patescibacteria group bacterium]|nr:YdcF family protein [Patescibacteria group bacterium]MBP9710111.1 YdcF family protein [Patescibacteria group bacterium]